MATTEELLQELITLQKEEMQRNRRDRQLRFYLHTLPTFLIILVSILSVWWVYEATQTALENMAELDSGDLMDYFR